MGKNRIYTLTKHAGSSLTRVRQVIPVSKGHVTYGIYENGQVAATAGLSAGDLYIKGNEEENEGIGVVSAVDVTKAKDIYNEERIDTMIKAYYELSISLEVSLKFAAEAQDEAAAYYEECVAFAIEEGKDPSTVCAYLLSILDAANATVADLEAQLKAALSAIAILEGKDDEEDDEAKEAK
tara:strand:+ start:1534 stop:2076 length:543 start_codon:yes stop_codon:yes gene_type:complete